MNGVNAGARSFHIRAKRRLTLTHRMDKGSHRFTLHAVTRNRLRKGENKISE